MERACLETASSFVIIARLCRLGAVAGRQAARLLITALSSDSSLLT